MKRKKVIIVGTVLFLLGGMMSAFGGIPGITEPYNPPAFYSPTVPDYEDSPSVFGTRYLISHSQEVYDPKRHSESVKYGKNLMDILEMVKEVTGLKVRNTTPLGNHGQENIEKIIVDTNNMNSLEIISKIQGKKIFRDGSTVSNFQAPDIKKEQLEALAQAYAAVAQDAKMNMTDLEYRMAALDEAVKKSADGAGYLQAVQSKNEINSLREAEELRYNALLNDYLNLLYLESIKEQDEEIRRMANNPRFRVADQYNLTEADKILYPNAVREKSTFIDF